MADVFISYANQDRDRASLLAEFVEAAGMSVWWDRQLLPGDDFERVIDAQLNEAKAIIIMWSDHSVGSHWVRSEADTALRQGKMCPIRIGQISIPRPFDQVHTLDLTDWSGENSPELEQLVTGAKARLDGKALPQKRQPFPTKKRRPFRAVASVAVLLVAVAGGMSGFRVWFETNNPAQQPDEVPNEVAAIPAGEGGSITDEGAVRLALRRLSNSNLPSDQIVLALLEKGNTIEAINTLFKSYHERSEHMTALERTETLHQIGAFAVERDTDLAIVVYSELLSIDPEDVTANLLIGRMYYHQDNIEPAKRHLNVAINNEHAGEAVRLKASNYLGEVMNMEGEHEAAISWLTSVAARAEQAGLDEAQSGALNRLAMVHKELNRLPEAKGFLERSIPIQQRIGLDTHLAHSYQVLAEIAELEGDLETTESYLNKALALQADIQYPLARVGTLLTLGNVLLKKGDFRGADARYAEGAATAFTQKMMMEHFEFLLGQARVDIALEDKEAACRHVTEAEQRFPKNRNIPESLAVTLEEIGCHVPS